MAVSQPSLAHVSMAGVCTANDMRALPGAWRAGGSGAHRVAGLPPAGIRRSRSGVSKAQRRCRSASPAERQGESTRMCSIAARVGVPAPCPSPHPGVISPVLIEQGQRAKARYGLHDQWWATSAANMRNQAMQQPLWQLGHRDRPKYAQLPFPA